MQNHPLIKQRLIYCGGEFLGLKSQFYSYWTLYLNKVRSKYGKYNCFSNCFYDMYDVAFFLPVNVDWRFLCLLCTHKHKRDRSNQKSIKSKKMLVQTDSSVRSKYGNKLLKFLTPLNYFHGNLFFGSIYFLEVNKPKYWA